MRFPLVRVLVACVFIVLPAASYATTYYVTQGGSNSNACTTASAPCLTIAGAIGKATSAGDIIQVASGTYNENPNLSHAGTSGNLITLRGSTGTCPTTSVADANSPTGTRPASTVNITGFISITANYVAVDCVHLLGSGISINSNLTGGLVTNAEIDGNGRSTPGGGIYIAGVATVTSANYTTNFTFTKNYIHNMSNGFYVACSGCLAQDNEISTLTGDEPGSDHDYINFWGVGSTINHNYMHGNTINACNSYDCHMDCMQVYNTTGDGKEVSKDNIFSRNVCFNHHEGVIAQDNAGNGDIQNWTVVNNVFAYGPWDDGSGHPGTAGTVHPWCWVFEDGKLGNNTFNNNTCIAGSMGFRSAQGSAVFNDNIFFTFGSSTTIYDTSGTAVTGSNNLYYAASGNFSRGTFTGDIVNKNPGFVSTGSGGSTQCIGCNYNIQSTSAAIDAGISTVPSVVIDLLNTARPQGGAYDIGAYEFTTNSKPQPAPPQNLTGVAR